jgi:hypothetical protein
MRPQFEDVLALESAHLTGVADGAELHEWREHIVDELMTPSSPYVQALQLSGEVSDKAAFIRRWRELIEEALERVRTSGTGTGANHRATQPARTDVDPRKIAVLILAAVHGGSTLSQIAGDPWPLNAALDIALAPYSPKVGDIT